MDAEQKRATFPCTRLHELPPVSTDWQQTTWCPACDYYCLGTCSNPLRTDGNAACPFDGKPLPLREVVVQGDKDQPLEPPVTAAFAGPQSQPSCETLEQTVIRGIMGRTGRRIQSLEVEVRDGEVLIRGSVPCYYVKQLALQGVLDVIRSINETEVELNIQVEVCHEVNNGRNMQTNSRLDRGGRDEP